MNLGQSLYNALANELFYLETVEKVMPAYEPKEKIWDQLGASIYYPFYYDIVIVSEQFKE